MGAKYKVDMLCGGNDHPQVISILLVLQLVKKQLNLTPEETFPCGYSCCFRTSVNTGQI
jgi:hypothetical protein